MNLHHKFPYWLVIIILDIGNVHDIGCEQVKLVWGRVNEVQSNAIVVVELQISLLQIGLCVCVFSRID